MQNLAVVGASHIHMPNFVRMLKERTDVAVRWVWDSNPAVAKKMAGDLSAQVADNPETIWKDASVNAVVICSETNRHLPLVMAAAAARKHLFVEKPLGLGAVDSYQMAEAIEKAGVIFQTGYFNRGNGMYRFLREQIRLGRFGKLTRIRCVNAHAGGMLGWFIDKDWSWMTDLKQAGCGAFGDLGAHALDIMLYLLGTDVERVTASVHVASGKFGETDEYGEAMLLFKNGLVGSLAAGWVDVRNPVKLELSGMEGYAAIIDGKLYFKSAHVEGATGETPWTNDVPENAPHAFQLYLDAINGKTSGELVNLREAAIGSAVMEALYQSAREVRWVTPKIQKS